MNEHNINMDMKPSTMADFENKYKLMVHNISTHLEDKMSGQSEIVQLQAMNGISSYMVQNYGLVFREMIRQLESFMDSFQEMESMRGHYAMKFADYDRWKEQKVNEVQFFQRKFHIMMREISREIKRLENDNKKSITEKLENL